MTLRVVAIDGVLGAGKTTIAKRLAGVLGLEYLDTGAMYRAVALACLRNGVSLDDPVAVASVAATVRIALGHHPDGSVSALLDDVEVATDIRSPEVTRVASTVATNADVRAYLVAQQREWARIRGGGVLEGRDIATVVFPDAPVKIFLTASVEARARRRHAEQPERAFEEVVADLEWRDNNDASRAADPLRVAEGATVLDTTGLTLDEVVARAERIARAGLDTVVTPTITPTAPAGADGDHRTAPLASGALGAKQAPEPPFRPGSVPSAPLPGGAGSRVPSRLHRAVFRGIRTIVVGFVRVYFRVRIEGIENVPTTGAFLVSPVHRSNVDSVVVPSITRRRMRFLGKDTMWKFRQLGRLFDILGGIKVVRGTTDRESMKLCLAALENGDPVVVYPEGRRKEGPVVEDLFDGVAYMAVKAGVAIIPIGIGGSAAAMAVSHRFPRPKPIHLVIGKPLRVPAGLSPASSRKAIRALTVELRTEMQRLYDEAQASVR